MRLDCQQRQSEEESFPTGTEEAPVSGVHSMRPSFEGQDLSAEDWEVRDGVQVYVSDFPFEERREEAEQPVQSWILGILRSLKERVSSPPPAPEVKEFIPFGEQQLIDRLKMEQDGLGVFETILENREMLYFNALAAGMSAEAIRTSDDTRFDPALTDTWRERLEEKRRLVADLRRKIEIMSRERRLKYGFVPAPQGLPRF